MSTSHFEQRKKSLDTFFWVNEITGEVTYPLLKADVPAAPLEKPQETPGCERCERGSAQGALPSAQGRASSPEPKADSPSPPTALLRYRGARSFFPTTLTQPLAEAGARSPSLFSATPVTISPPGGAPPLFSPFGPAPPPPASTFPSCPSVLWAYTCKLKNVLTGNNRFSF